DVPSQKARFLFENEILRSFWTNHVVALHTNWAETASFVSSGCGLWRTGQESKPRTPISGIGAPCGPIRGEGIKDDRYRRIRTIAVDKPTVVPKRTLVSHVAGWQPAENWT